VGLQAFTGRASTLPPAPSSAPVSGQAVHSCCVGNATAAMCGAFSWSVHCLHNLSFCWAVLPPCRRACQAATSCVGGGPLRGLLPFTSAASASQASPQSPSTKATSAAAASICCPAGYKGCVCCQAGQRNSGQFRRDQADYIPCCDRAAGRRCDTRQAAFTTVAHLFDQLVESAWRCNLGSSLQANACLTIKLLLLLLLLLYMQAMPLSASSQL
jgi:hypothetical protein